MNFVKTLKDALTIKFDKAFGLDISDRSVEIIELEKVFRFSVYTYGRAELPEGVIENGKILNQNILAEKIKNLLKEVKPARVSTNNVIISLPESQVYVHCFLVASELKHGALTSEVIAKASLAMPMNIDKTYWDFMEKPTLDKTKKLIIFISVPKEIANSYVKFCNSIGLEVMSLCVESLSLARILLKSSAKQTLIMDIGSKSTNLSFFDSNDKINLALAIPIAGDHMTQVIKDTLKVEYAEAESLKNKFGFREGGGNNVRPLILPILESILKETKEAITYYETTFNQKLDDVYIIGGSSVLPAITEVIKSNLKREIQLGASGYNIDLKSLADKKNYFPLYANVISLGMLGASGEFKDMNLIKKMPSSEVNMVHKLNLFEMGYLSKVNTVRAILNNKYVLVMMVTLVLVVFAVLFQQAQNYLFTDISTSTSKVVSPIKLPPLSTSSSFIKNIGSTSTLPLPIKVTPPPAVPTTSSSANFIFAEEKIPGSYGNTVTELQARLTKDGYYNGLVGGFFGPATETALKAYQKANGLAETGILDAVTRAKLNAK